MVASRIFSVIVLVLIAVGLTGYDGGAERTQSPKLTPEEAYILLDNLLGLTEKKDDIRDQLAEWKKWEKVYIKYSRMENPTEQDIKVYLMMVFIADVGPMIHTLEESAEDTLPIYVRHRRLFLKVLEENPFLVPSACKQIREYFDCYRRPGKQNFIKANKGLIMDSLGGELGMKCIEELSFEYEPIESNKQTR